MSPRSNNLQERKKQNQKLEKVRDKVRYKFNRVKSISLSLNRVTDKIFFVSIMEVSGVVSEAKSKENVADNNEEKEEKRVQSAPNTRPPTMRKRSYSFSDGN